MTEKDISTESLKDAGVVVSPYDIVQDLKDTVSLLDIKFFEYRNGDWVWNGMDKDHNDIVTEGLSSILDRLKNLAERL